MNRTVQQRRQPHATQQSICRGVLAHAVAQVNQSGVPALRERLGKPGFGKITPKFLRHVDVQTLVGLAALRDALQVSALSEHDLHDWGVIAAPRFLGRNVCAHSMAKFPRTGPAGTSPHVIPQQSSHAVAGAVSVALGMRGPNFGVGGGPGWIGDGLLAALMALVDQDVPGICLLLTGWYPEPTPDETGASPTASTCTGIALVLVHETSSTPWRLQYDNQELVRDTRGEDSQLLEELAAWLTNTNSRRDQASWTHSTGAAGWLRLSAASVVPPPHFID